ncbi:Nup85p KNAG_0G00610 [Huiozyma naganishii CBS 8797]|uniref:Nuclear pore complex protein Nup85 n=1 Tax=Huiozyma naganishii (strain ATCC MYA-139 / BCRC 22969 / CBS 8797 / KCTC 17520 / NBRC 10181 / NCYC 3082 / Yp74L-3) TaxID=1071383 RepID=J7RNI8_HUIN7|nr:hypothetical protein KNAG_0G00610 [Kazachstania naganishii CBS 8797]CCK71118.1 hypothetical protein KNAG_0G00610 [Kazachstania naganishii CBS 8797]
MGIVQNNDLLMDVDAMDFVDDSSSEISDTSNTPVGIADQSFDRDPVTGEISMKLTSVCELPLRKGELGHLKFKLGPVASSNVAFLTMENQHTIYPVRIPRLDTSARFSEYIKKLFEIYESLGDDRAYSIPTIGVINTDSQNEHVAAVNLAMDALVSELEMFIDALKEDDRYLTRFLELEESLTILNCLRLNYFIIDSPDSESIRDNFTTSLLKWVNRSDGEPNSDYIEQVFQLASPEKQVFETSFFWKLLNQLLLRGLFQQAVGCIERSELIPYLEKTCDVSASAVINLVQLVNQYPLENADTFREWKSLTLELSQNFANSETDIGTELRGYLEDTLLLVSGNEDKIVRYSRTWYESFCGFLLYYIPSLELAPEYLEISLKNNPLDITNSWERSCADIIKGSVYSILPVLESLDACTASFTAALVEAKGLLETNFANELEQSEDNLFSNGMANYMLSNFALELCSMDDKSLWPVAIGIISLVPSVSTSAKKAAISELLEHYPFKTNDDIEWLLSVCAQWKLPEVAKSVYTMLGTSMINEGKTIEAMTNFSKAGKFDLVKDFSWTLFEASALQGSPLGDEILDSIVSTGMLDSNHNMVISDEILDTLVTDAMRQALAPYAVLFRFYDAQQQGNSDLALELLMLLITFPYLPDCYFVLLVCKFLYPIFLLNDSTVIDEATVLTIMNAIETKWNSIDEKSQNIYDEVVSKDDKDLRTVLPDDLDDLLKRVRQKLSFKLCQEFM